MLKHRLYLSTIDPAAGDLAREHSLGLEVAEYCTAWNLDAHLPEADAAVRGEIRGIDRLILHGPFNELYPCAVDPLARELAARRFCMALERARRYGIRKVVLHGGFDPHLYFPQWFTEQSALFWRAFLQDHPGDYEICLENVLEPDPTLLRDIVRAVNDPRLRLCLDVGHVNAYTDTDPADWIRAWGEDLSHAHIHNNFGTVDTHGGLDEGNLPLADLLPMLENATMTLELPHIGDSLQWLQDRNMLKKEV